MLADPTPSCVVGVRQSMLWEEHEGYLRGNWLVTSTEPRLYYMFSKYSVKVQGEIEKGASKQKMMQPSCVVRRPVD